MAKDKDAVGNCNFAEMSNMMEVCVCVYIYVFICIFTSTSLLLPSTHHPLVIMHHSPLITFHISPQIISQTITVGDVGEFGDPTFAPTCAAMHAVAPAKVCAPARSIALNEP